MKITALKYQKKDPNRVNIFVDGEYSFSLHVNNLLKHGLNVSSELDETEIEKIIADDLESRLYGRAVQYLGRGLKSSSQVERYLTKVLDQKKGDWFDEDKRSDFHGIEREIVNKLSENGYVDDEKFAESYVQAVVSRKNLSKVYLHGKLYSFGIPKEIATRVIEQNLTDEESSARALLSKKYGKESLSKSDRKEIQFLQRKGFSWDLISKLIDS